MKRIVYPNIDNGISIIIPSPNATLTIDQIALKDVPLGKPYRIVEDSDIPTDRTFRDAWEMDFSAPDGFGLGYEEYTRRYG